MTEHETQLQKWQYTQLLRQSERCLLANINGGTQKQNIKGLIWNRVLSKI
jgi:hypothetical protein